MYVYKLLSEGLKVQVTIPSILVGLQDARAHILRIQVALICFETLFAYSSLSVFFLAIR